MAPVAALGSLAPADLSQLESRGAVQVGQVHHHFQGAGLELEFGADGVALIDGLEPYTLAEKLPEGDGRHLVVTLPRKMGLRKRFQSYKRLRRQVGRLPGSCQR